MQTNHATPILSILAEDQIHLIHDQAKKILSDIGIRVVSKTAQNYFKESGTEVDKDGIVKIDGNLVDHACNTSPGKIDFFDQNGKFSFSLDSANTKESFFGIGVTNLWYEDPKEKNILPFTRELISDAVKLGDNLSSYHIISTPGIINDSSRNTDLLVTLEMLANTSKPIVLLVSDASKFELVIEMTDNIKGLNKDKPFLLPYFNPITPLVLNKKTSDGMIHCIKNDIPYIYSNYGMSGSTSPALPFANLVLLHAELMAGLVFSQLVKEGSSIITGSLPASFNMQSMTSCYTPDSMLVNLACAELHSYFGIPHCGSSGSGNGWGPDLTSAGMLWMNHLISSIGKVGLAPFVGGNFDSLVFSPETVVYASEVINSSKKFARGFDLSSDELWYNEIKNAGHNGNFLTSESTLMQMMDERLKAQEIWPALSLKQWQDMGNPKPDKILHEKTLELINASYTPEYHDEVIAKGEKFISNNM